MSYLLKSSIVKEIQKYRKLVCVTVFFGSSINSCPFHGMIAALNQLDTLAENILSML